MELKYILPYLGISVLIYFIAQLIEYWLDIKEKGTNVRWYLWPIAILCYIMMLVSMPAGMLIWILDQVYNRKADWEDNKKIQDAKKSGMEIGYIHGKKDGYSYGYRDGFEYGYTLPDHSKSIYSLNYWEYARVQYRKRINEAGWENLPNDHFEWTPTPDDI